MYFENATSSLSRTSKQNSMQPNVSNRKWTNKNANGVSVYRVKVLANWNATKNIYCNGKYNVYKKEFTISSAFQKQSHGKRLNHV